MFDLKQKYKEIVEYKMFHEIDWMKLQLLENEIVVEFPNILVYLNGEHPLE